MRRRPAPVVERAVCVLCGREVRAGVHLERWRDSGHAVRLVERG